MASSEFRQFPLEEEYAKKTGITPADVAELRRWLATQPHLPATHITDLDLILAFNACDCSTGVTKQVLDLNYTIRTLFTSYFKDRRFDDRALKCLECILITPLQTRTKEGYVVVYTHILDNDSKNFNFIDFIRCAFMLVDVWQYKEGTWPGLVLVHDFEGISLSHVAKMDIHNVQQSLYYLQEAILVKVKGFHFINAPSFVDKFMMLMKPFLKKDLMDTFSVHGTGCIALESIVPLEAFPKECGGEYKSFQECKDEVIATLRAAESYLKNENQKRVTESLRPGKPKTMSDIFGGVVGSFKKLDLD